MEYLGRLGLVPRKSKKDRETSPQTKRCAEESRALKTDLTRAIETDLTCATSEASSLTATKPGHTQARLVEIHSTTTSTSDFPKPATIVDIARLPIPSDCNTTTTPTPTASSFFPRSSCVSTTQESTFIDIEYFQYEQHVQAQAQARAQALNNVNHSFGAPGGRHAWKTLIFWKRRRTSTSRSAGIDRSAFVSACSTPARHHGFQTPKSSSSSRQNYYNSHDVNSRCNYNSSPAQFPLYMSDDFDSIQMAWYEPMLRRGKMQDEGYCNRSPYVALGGRRSQRIASPGPLYLV